MADMQRREMIKAAGAAGTGLAFGAGAASGQQEQTEATQQQGVETTFSATVDKGFLVLGGSNPDDQDAVANIDVSNTDGTVSIEGEVYEDRTWSSTSVDFPELDPTQLIDASSRDIIEAIEYDSETTVTVEVNSISGVYNPSAPNGGLVTGDIDLFIDAFMTGTMILSSVDVPFTFDFFIDVNSGEDITLTTETSNALDGNASGLDTNSATATIVSNNFTVPEAEGPMLCADVSLIYDFCVNNLLNLPVNQSTQNWMELTIEPGWDGAPPFVVPELPGGEAPPQDLDGDGKLEDITGSGDITIFDTQALFTNLDNEKIQNNAKFFNFSQYSDDDEVSILDVASHWKEYIDSG